MAKGQKIVDQFGQPIPVTPSATSAATVHPLAGGMYNPVSGMGGGGDKGNSGLFIPTLFLTRLMLETIYVESWAAGKFIDIPVDDMFILGRDWAGDGEREIDAMKDAERELNCYGVLTKAMKSGRLYGTGLAIMLTREAPLDTPLMIEKIKQGDFSSLLAFDRYDATIESYVIDPFSPDYGKPEIYRIQPRGLAGSPPIMIHSSRVLRFDGKKALSSDGWAGGYYDQNWGVSELIPALTEITHDAGMTGAIAHLAQEASIPVIKTEGFKESIVGQVAPDEATPEQIGQKINYHKSVFRTLFLDANDDFNRVNVTFAGLPELMDKFSARLAAIAGIPATRFLSQSPAGLNSTGESDMKNYALHVGAMQERLLTEPLRRLDEVLSRHAGIAEAPEYEWKPLLDMSNKEQAEVSKLRAEALNAGLSQGAIEENEWRERMSELGDPIFGMLDPLPEEAFDPPEPAPAIPPAPGNPTKAPPKNPP